MMSRSEEIKGVVKSWLAWNDWNGAQINTLKDILTYLERVQELEDIIYKDERQAVIEALYEDNQRYRQALEFYADDDKWYEVNTGSPYAPDYRREIEDDLGKVAQKALEGESE